MARTEIVTITNMCMVYEGNKVLVQEKIDDDYCGIMVLCQDLVQVKMSFSSS